MAEGTNDETYGESFERIGPELDVEQRAGVLAVCAPILAREDATLEDFMAAFRDVCVELVKLEHEHRSGQEMDASSAEEFVELYVRHQEFLDRTKVNPNLREYYRQVLKGMKEETLLGTLIQRYDEAYFFTAGLNSALEDDADGDIKRLFESSINSQDDFYAWKDYIVMFVEDFDDGENEEAEDD